MMWLLAGRNLKVIAGLVLAVGLISFGMIQYGKSIQKETQATEDLKDNVETRQRIDNAIRNRPSDAVDALRLLRERQGIN